MKKNNTQQELMFVTSSAFMQKELCENDTSKNNELSTSEKLEEACWNGMLKDWSWGSITGNKKDEKLFLWKVYTADRILCACVSKVPVSIDPYLFMQARTKHYN